MTWRYFVLQMIGQLTTLVFSGLWRQTGQDICRLIVVAGLRFAGVVVGMIEDPDGNRVAFIQAS